MDHVPVFLLGQQVRIMQTPDTEKRGLANVKGMIMAAVGKPGGDLTYTVRLDSPGKPCVKVGGCYLSLY